MTGMFDDFLNDYARRGRTKTAETYGRLLSQFERWLEGRGAAGFDREDVLKFLAERPWSATSKNLALTALRGWARDEKAKVPPGADLSEMQRGRDIEKRLDRISALRGFTVRREEKPALSLEQISTLLDAMDPNTSTLFWLLCWTGLRVGELKMIKNIDWEAGRLTVETEKAGGLRVLFFDKNTGELLKHAKERGLLDIPNTKIWRMFRRYSHFCQPVKLSPHACRHAFASKFAELTDRDTLRKMLGHGAKDATDIYVHVGEERIREVMVERHYLRPLEPDFGKNTGGRFENVP